MLVKDDRFRRPLRARQNVMQRHVLCCASVMMASARVDLVFKLSRRHVVVLTASRVGQDR